ncbi:MAG: nickel pincer cofactor biosynthesis protein LarB [Dissulfurispiraceae bacterium]
MDEKILKTLLRDVKTGRIPVGRALDTLRHLPYEELDFAKVDHHRSLRSVIPEVIFAQNKETDAVVAIAHAMLKKSGRFLITRAREDIYAALNLKESKFYHASRIIACGKIPTKKGFVLIVSAGTSDIPVAEEAEVTASFLGSRTGKIIDVGVAGIHRLLSFRRRIAQASVVIVVAGMEGALPSVVGGLTDKPVIAVPTSVGYGTSLGGLTALFAMLNSCVPGLAVVNIDNGFGAGCLAHKINIIGLKSR